MSSLPQCMSSKFKYYIKHSFEGNFFKTAKLTVPNKLVFHFRMNEYFKHTEWDKCKFNSYLQGKDQPEYHD